MNEDNADEIRERLENIEIKKEIKKIDKEIEEYMKKPP